MDMNEFEGKWKLIRGQSQVWWSRITDADLETVERAGIKYFKYVTLVQLRYGYDRQAIKDAIDKHVVEYEAGLKIDGAGGNLVIVQQQVVQDRFNKRDR